MRCFTLVLGLVVVHASSYTLNINGVGPVTPELPVRLRLMRSYGLGEKDDTVPINITGPVLYPLTFKHGNGTLWHTACPHMASIPQIYPNLKTVPAEFPSALQERKLDNFYDFYEDPVTGTTSCDAATAPYNVNGKIVMLSANFFVACEIEANKQGRGSCMFDTYEQAGALAIVLFWSLPAEMGVGVPCAANDGNKVKSMPIFWANIWEDDFFGRGDFGPDCDGQLPPFAGDPRTDPPTPGFLPEYANTMVDVNQNSLLYLAFAANTGLTPAPATVMLTLQNDGYHWTKDHCKYAWEGVLWFLLAGLANVFLIFFSIYLLIRKHLWKTMVGYVIFVQGVLAPVMAAVRELAGPLWVCKSSLGLKAAIFFGSGDSVSANVATVASLLLWGKMVLVRHPRPWMDPAIAFISSCFFFLYIPILDQAVSGDPTDLTYLNFTANYTYVTTFLYILISCVALYKISAAGKASGSSNVTKLIRSFKWIAMQILFLGVMMTWMVTLGSMGEPATRYVKD